MKQFIFITVMLLVWGVCPSLYAQESQHIVILWDVTGSLLPAEQGQKDIDGSELQVYNNATGKGNGMWVPLKKAVIECIEYVEEDPGNKITIVTFTDNIRDVFSQNASDSGKQTLIDVVKKYKYKKNNYTNIVDPIKKFYTLLDENYIKYMFLFTDGENDQPATKQKLIPTLDAWSAYTKGKDAYGFYVLVHPDADKEDIRRSIDKQDNIWIVPDAKVRIKFLKLPSKLKYNIRDEKGPKKVELLGNYNDVKGDIQITSKDEYYDVLCSKRSISDGFLDFEVKLKLGKNPPKTHTIVLEPQILDSDEYTFIGPKEVYCEVSNLPERSLSLFVDGNDWGTASYYEAFLGGLLKESYKPIVSNIKVNFSNQAIQEGSFATIKVYLVDKKGENKFDLSSKGFKLLINDEEVKDYYSINSKLSDIKLSIEGLSKAESGKYYGRIDVEPHNLDNYYINGDSGVFRWRFEFKHKWNPIKTISVWFIGLFLLASLIWMTLLKPVFYPKFGSIVKTFIIPGYAPLYVKFKGARKVVISSALQKKQRWWDIMLKGRIIYKTHPAFITPMIFVPGRGKKILVRAQSDAYQISPNPMPGIGAAVITDVRKNVKINVN